MLDLVAGVALLALGFILIHSVLELLFGKGGNF